MVVPLMNTITRHLEEQADEFSLQLTDNPASFTTAMAKLTDQNLAEADSSRLIQALFRDHPSYVQRAKHARLYADTKIKPNHRDDTVI